MKKIKLALAQMEVVPANPAVNVHTMLHMIEQAKAKGADVVVFPEMCIPGYLIGDLWEQTAFIEECVRLEKDIITASEGIVVIYGNIMRDVSAVNEDGRVRKYNCLMIAEDGQLADWQPKTLQPNYREFDDNRHFYDNRKHIVDSMLKCPYGDVDWPLEFFRNLFRPFVTKSGLRLGGILCEDAWDTDYSFSPMAMLMGKCDIVINISCSPYTSGKNFKRNRLFSAQAKRFKVPMVYVNNVGIQNNGKTVYAFDGESCVYDKAGGILAAELEPFAQGLAVLEVDLDSEFGTMQPESARFKDDIGTLYHAIRYGVEKFMAQLHLEKVVIGASGGIDSALVSAIMSEILPKENIWLVNMPSKKYSSKTTRSLAAQLAGNIGCQYGVISIDDSVALTAKQMEGCGFTPSTFILENIQARDRSSRILAACAASFGGVFTCNANKSEMTVGYTTLYGDLGGFMAPISDLWKTQVYEMAEWFNKNVKNIIPQGCFTVKPSAELSSDQNVEEGKGDPLIYEYHDKLFASWVERWSRATPEDILEWAYGGTLEKNIDWARERGSVVATVFNGNVKAFIDDVERWWNQYQGMGVAKRIQAPPVMAVSRRAFGFDHRESQVRPYYTERYYDLKKLLLKKS